MADNSEQPSESDQTLRSLSRSLIAPLKQISHEIEEGARSNELSTSQDNQDYSDDMACLELLSTAESDTLTPSVEFCTSFKLKSKSSHSIGSHSKSKSTLGDSNLTLTNLSLSRKEMNQVETTMEDVNHEGDDEEEDNDDDNDHEQESEDYESDDSYAARFVSCLKSITAYASLTQSVAYRDDVSLCGGLFRVITARNRQNADQQNFAFLAKIKEFANSSNSEPAEQMRKHRLEYNEIWIWWRDDDEENRLESSDQILCFDGTYFDPKSYSSTSQSSPRSRLAVFHWLADLKSDLLLINCKQATKKVNLVVSRNVNKRLVRKNRKRPILLADSLLIINSTSSSSSSLLSLSSLNSQDNKSNVLNKQQQHSTNKQVLIYDIDNDQVSIETINQVNITSSSATTQLLCHIINKNIMVLNTEWIQLEVIELLNESAPKGGLLLADATSLNLNASLGASSKSFLNASLASASSAGGGGGGGSSASSGSSSGFGFGITGNKSTGVVVKAITPGGSACRDGRLRINDQIFQIGEVNVRNMNSEQVASILKQSSMHGQLVKFIVARPVHNTVNDVELTSGGAVELSPELAASGSLNPASGQCFLIRTSEIMDKSMNLSQRFATELEKHTNLVTGSPANMNQPQEPTTATVEETTPPLLTEDSTTQNNKLPDSESAKLSTTPPNVNGNITEEAKTTVDTVRASETPLQAEPSSTNAIQSTTTDSSSTPNVVAVNEADTNKDVSESKVYEIELGLDSLCVESDGQDVVSFFNKLLKNYDIAFSIDKESSTIFVSSVPKPCTNILLAQLEVYDQVKDANSLPVNLTSSEVEASSFVASLKSSLSESKKLILRLAANFEFKARQLRAKWLGLLRSQECDEYRKPYANFELIISRVDKSKSRSLGISLEGTVDVDENGLETYPHHYVRSIMQNGPIDRALDAKFKPGDELLEIDFVKLYAINYLELLDILKSLSSKILVLVCARRIIKDSNTPVSSSLSGSFKRAKSEGHLESKKLKDDDQENKNEPNVSHDQAKHDDTHLIPVTNGIKSMTKSTPIINEQQQDTSESTTTPTRHLSTDIKKQHLTMSQKSPKICIRSRSLELNGLSLWNKQIHYITLVKSPKGLGFSLVDYQQDPFNPLSKIMIVVRSLMPNGVAFQDGRLMPGQRLVSINNIVLDEDLIDEIETSRQKQHSRHRVNEAGSEGTQQLKPCVSSTSLSKLTAPPLPCIDLLKYTVEVLKSLPVGKKIRLGVQKPLPYPDAELTPSSRSVNFRNKPNHQAKSPRKTKVTRSKSSRSSYSLYNNKSISSANTPRAVKKKASGDADDTPVVASVKTKKIISTSKYDLKYEIESSSTDVSSMESSEEVSPSTSTQFDTDENLTATKMAKKQQQEKSVHHHTSSNKSGAPRIKYGILATSSPAILRSNSSETAGKQSRLDAMSNGGGAGPHSFYSSASLFKLNARNLYNQICVKSLNNSKDNSINDLGGLKSNSLHRLAAISMTKSGSPFLKQETEVTITTKVEESSTVESKESKAKLMINSLNYLNFILSESTEQRNQQQLQELQEDQHQAGDQVDKKSQPTLDVVGGGGGGEEHKIVYADDEIALLNANFNILDNKLNEDSSKQLTSEEQFNQAFLLNTNKKLINLLETSKYLNYIDDEHSDVSSRTAAATARNDNRDQQSVETTGVVDDTTEPFILTQLDDECDETATTSSILTKIQLDTCQIDKQKLTHNQNYDKPKSKKSKSAKKTVAASSNQQQPAVDLVSNSFDLTIRSIKSGEDNNNNNNRNSKDNEDQELYAMVKDMANFKWPDTLNTAASASLVDNTIGLYDDRAVMIAQQEADLMMIEQPPKESRKSRKKEKKTKYVSKTRSPSRARRKHHDYDDYDDCDFIKPTVRFRSVSRSALKEDGRQARLSMMPMSASASREQNSSVKIINILGKDIVKYPTFLEREIKIKKHFYPLGLTSVDCQVDEGINGSVILKIDDNSACSRDGRLKVGDYLLSVNNEQMRNLTNSSARSILSRASLTSKDVVIIYIPLVDAIKFKEHLRKHCLLPMGAGGTLKQQTTSSRQHSADARQQRTAIYSSSSSSICSSLFSSSSISSISKLSPTCSSMSELECNKQKHQRQRRYVCSTCSLTSSNLSLSSNSRENKDTTTTTNKSDSGGSKTTTAKSDQKTASTSSSSFLKYLTKSGSKSSPKPSAVESSKSATIDSTRNTGDLKKESSLKTSKSSDKSNKLNESRTGHDETKHLSKSATLGTHFRSLSSNNREISKKSYHCCHHCEHCHHLNKSHHKHGEHHQHHKRHYHDHSHSHHHRHNHHIDHCHHHSEKRQSHSHHHHHHHSTSHRTHNQCEFCTDLVDSKTKKQSKRHSHHHHHHRREQVDKQPIESIKPSQKKTSVLVYDEELERSGRSSSLREVSDLISQTSSFVTNQSSSFAASSSIPGLASDLGMPLNEAITTSLWGPPRIVVLNREEGKSLGISIVGGKLDVCSSSAASPSQQQSSLNTSPQPAMSFISGIFIKHVLDKSPAGLNGTLKTGDRILAVNEVDLTNASHDRAVEAIRSARSPIRFTIQSLICINEPSPPKTVTDTPVKADTTITKKSVDSNSTISTSEESSKASTSQIKVDSPSTSVAQVKNVEENLVEDDRVVIDQPNKYNYSLEDVKDKYSYLLDPSANANNSTGSFDATETNPADDQTARESSPASGSNSSGGNRELYIFKLTRSFLGESLGLSLSGNVNLNKTSVFVCGIYANSIAHRHGLIKVGDQILEINGQSIYGRAHSNVTPLIKNVKELDVFMVVLRNPDNMSQMFKPLYIVNNTVPLKSSNRSSSASSPCSTSPPSELVGAGHNDTMTTNLTVDSNKSTAVNLTQSSSNQSSFQTASNQSPSCGKVVRKILLRKGPTGFGIAISEDKHGRLIVRGLNPSGVAFQDGRMQVGDQIIIVNNLQVGTMKYDEIMTLLHETKEPVEFQVIKPDQMTNSSSVQNTTASSNSASGSTSPLTNATLKQQKQSSKTQSEANSRKQSVTTMVPTNPKTDPIKVGEETWIEIERGKLGLGLSIVGGSDTQLAGIIIHDIYATGAASKDGRLAIGDQILKVNNTDLTNATHEQALNALRQTSDVVKLLIMRSIQPTRSSSGAENSSQQQSDQGPNSNGSSTPSNVLIDLMSTENEKYLNIMTIELTKKFGKGLGFSIIGRRDGSGVFISHIIDGGCAHKDGRLMVGDLILEVNSQDIRKMPYNDVAFLLKTLPQGRVILKIGRFKTSASNSANASATQSLTSSQQGSKQPSRRNSIGGSNNNNNNNASSSSTTISSSATVIPPSASTPLTKPSDDSVCTTNEPTTSENSKLTTFKPCLKK